MSIRIDPNRSAEEVKLALEKLMQENKNKPLKNMLPHFGKLKRGLDGLEYQNTVRNDWD